MRAYRGLWVSVESNGWDKTATMKHIVCQEILSRWNDEGRRYGGLVDCGSLGVCWIRHLRGRWHEEWVSLEPLPEDITVIEAEKIAERAMNGNNN